MTENLLIFVIFSHNYPLKTPYEVMWQELTMF